MNSNNKPHTLKTAEIEIMLHLITIKVAAEKKMLRSKIVPKLSRIFLKKKYFRGTKGNDLRALPDFLWTVCEKNPSHFQLQIWPHLAGNPEEGLNDDLRR